MLFGVVLVALPLALNGIAWRLFLRNPDPGTAWRRRAFRIVLAGIAANYALFWTDFMVVPGRITCPQSLFPGLEIQKRQLPPVARCA
jgi:hypothetical protein